MIVEAGKLLGERPNLPQCVGQLSPHNAHGSSRRKIGRAVELQDILQSAGQTQRKFASFAGNLFLAFSFCVKNSGFYIRTKRTLCYNSHMSTTELLERVLGPFTECLTPDAAHKIIALRADPETQSRIDQLAEKANDGTLTSEERADYEKFRATFHVITILQSRARRLLEGQPIS